MRHEVVALARTAAAGGRRRCEWVEQDLRRAAGRRRGCRAASTRSLHLAQSPRYKEFPRGRRGRLRGQRAEHVRAARVGARGRRADVRARVHRRPVRLLRASRRRGRRDRADGFYFRAKYAAEVLLGALREPAPTRRAAAVLRLRRGPAADADRAARRADRRRRGDRRSRAIPGCAATPSTSTTWSASSSRRSRAPVSGVFNVAGPDVVSIVGARRGTGRGDRDRAGGAPPAGRDGGRPGRGDRPDARRARRDAARPAPRRPAPRSRGRVRRAASPAR